jgi:HPt (histidine-containing phosphotransfer) domain-containing protein
MLRELDDGDGELMGILAREYESDSTLQLAAMQRALADADTEIFVRSAHTLKGASANLGAAPLAELCARLEQLGRTGALDGAVSLVEAATTELDHVHTALDQLLTEA